MNMHSGHQLNCSNLSTNPIHSRGTGSTFGQREDNRHRITKDQAFLVKILLRTRQVLKKPNNTTILKNGDRFMSFPMAAIDLPPIFANEVQRNLHGVPTPHFAKTPFRLDFESLGVNHIGPWHQLSLHHLLLLLRSEPPSITPASQGLHLFEVPLCRCDPAPPRRGVRGMHPTAPARAKIPPNETEK